MPSLSGAVLSLNGPLHPQEDTLVRWHDVRSLLAASLEDPEHVDLRLHLESSYLDNLEPDGYPVDLGEGLHLDGDDLLDVVRWSLEAELREQLDDGRAALESRPGRLRVEGDARFQQRVDGIVNDLRSELLRAVELEVFVLPASAVSADTAVVLSPAQVDELIARAEPLDYARHSARVGQRVRLGDESTRAVLVDYDVEVATRARTPDPQITVLREGLSLGVLAQARPGGGFFLRVWGRQGAAQEPSRRLALEGLAGAPLELPVMQTTLGVSSAAIADGGGLLIGQNWHAGGVWLLRARSAASGTGASERGSAFLPLGELAALPLLVDSPWLPRTDPSGGWFRSDDTLLHQLGDETRELVIEPGELADDLREEGGELGLGGELQLIDDAFYVRGSSRLLDLAKLRVQQLNEALAQETVSVEVRLGLIEREQARHLTAEKTPEELAGVLERRLVGACRLGDTLLVLGGTERFYLMDHDVEIAESAVVSDPIIGNRFEGVSFWCLPNRAGEGLFSTWIDLQVQTDAGPSRELAVPTWEPRNPEQTKDAPTPTGTFQLDSKVELPSTARATSRSLVQLAEGQWTLVCCTSLAGTELSLVAVVRVR